MNEQCQDSCQHPCKTPDTLPIHTRKITDSCRDKDCIEDVRVFLTKSSQEILDACSEARVRCAELLYAYVDVEPIAFDRNHYCINVTFYYKILADAIVGASRPAALCGLAVFHKRAVLCGEDSSAHIFSSDTRLGEADGLPRSCAGHPTAIVEVLDPMILSSRVRDVCECRCHESCPQLPNAVHRFFDEELVLSGDRKRIYVTLGQFSIIRLERDAQLIVPIVNYALPTKPCCDTAGSAEDPCEMFSRIPFPALQFSPRGCDNRCDNPCGRPIGCGCKDRWECSCDNPPDCGCDDRKDCCGKDCHCEKDCCCDDHRDCRCQDRCEKDCRCTCRCEPESKDPHNSCGRCYKTT